MLHWVGDLHGNLLFGEMGLLANGIGGFLLAAMAVAGMVVWWPGIANWRRSMTIRRDVGWKRLNWDLHSAIGFSIFRFDLHVGTDGGVLSVPRACSGLRSSISRRSILLPRSRWPERRKPFRRLALWLGPPRPAFTYTVRRGPRRPPTKGQKILQWFSYLHYGNFAGWPVKVLWMVLGFAPPALFVTSLLMWWNRVLSPAARRFLRGPQSAPVEPESWKRAVPSLPKAGSSRTSRSNQKKNSVRSAPPPPAACSSSSRGIHQFKPPVPRSLSDREGSMPHAQAWDGRALRCSEAGLRSGK